MRTHRFMFSCCLCTSGDKEQDVTFQYNENTVRQSDNIMDKWVQSFTQSLIQFFRAEMDGENPTFLYIGIAHTKLAQSRQLPHTALPLLSGEVTSVSHCSVPPVHGGAAPRQVRWHAHQLVREDQPPPAQGETSPLLVLTFATKMEHKALMDH